MSLSKRTKIALFILATALTGAYIAYKYAYKAHKTIDELEIKFSGTAEAFSNKVQQDALIWQDVVVELEGDVTSIDEKGFTLNNNIYCQLNESFSTSDITEKQIIKIKGRMIGYDDLLEELKIDQVKIIK
ncbi:hypothetical protein [Psychroserpens sp. MEBiC05023]